jgi:diguanylate cyclase (GGDEF)-like protein
MLPTDIWHAYLETEHGGKKHVTPAGRLFVHNGQLHHLEDYYGHLSDIPEGTIDDYTMARLAAPPPGVHLASRSHIRSGFRPELIPEEELEPMPQKPAAEPPKARPPSVWHYFRAGHDVPHVLERKDGSYLLDGNVLKDAEVHKIVENLTNKTARLKYPKEQVAARVSKTEKAFSFLERLNKMMDLEEALRHLEENGDGSEKTKTAISILRQGALTDPQTGLGNRAAFDIWNKTERPGVHGVIDANFFKGVNDTYGHPAGDAAIKAYGGAIRDAMNAAAPPGENGGSAHRIGGDEFQVHFPSYEHAALFARKLHENLAKIPFFGGTHKPSLSMGVGPDHHMADAALYEAKRQKYLPTGEAHQPHTIPHVLFHSLVPGKEGAVQHEQLAPPKVPPAPPSPEEPSSAPPAAAPATPKVK